MFMIPDITVSLCSVAGLLAVLRAFQGQGTRDQTAYFFTSLLMMAAVFQAARVLTWLDITILFRFLTYATAAALPLVTFLLAEALLRRHAPLAAKYAVAGGAAVLMVAATLPWLTGNRTYAAALMLYQLGTFCYVAWMIWGRDLTTLTDAENRRIGQMGLALAALIPFLLTDFRHEMMPIPVRLSGLAVLVFCWVVLRQQVGHASRTDDGVALGLMTISATILGLLAAAQFGHGRTGGFQTAAMAISVILALDVLRLSLQARRLRNRATVLNSLSLSGDPAGFASFLNSIEDAAADEGVLFLQTTAIADFDPPQMIASFGDAMHISLRDLPAEPACDTIGQSQIRTLMNRYGATSVFVVAENPAVFAVAQRTAMSTALPSAELMAAFSMARIIARIEASP